MIKADWGKTEGSPQRLAILLGMLTTEGKVMFPNKDRSTFSMERYAFALEAPFEISDKCCAVMKKAPVHNFAKETGKAPITAQMADESRLRLQKWLQNGCNAFELSNPISNPMSFWTEQDVLWYITENKLSIASVYGDIKPTGKVIEQGFEQLEELKCCGVSRTGCMFCGFGCHLEKEPNRFQIMKKTHPKQYDYIMREKEKGGLNYKAVIDWINEHGNMQIKY